MLPTVFLYLASYATNLFSLWAASRLFRGLRFDTPAALAISALMLFVADSLFMRLLVMPTFPLPSPLALGLFLLVLKPLMIVWVSMLVKGFQVPRFRTAFSANIFIMLLEFVVNSLIGTGPSMGLRMPQDGLWL